MFDSWRSEQNGRQFADDNFKYILNEHLYISIKILLNFVSKGAIGNGFMLSRWQAITQSNDDTVHWRFYESSGAPFAHMD